MTYEALTPPEGTRVWEERWRGTWVDVAPLGTQLAGVRTRAPVLAKSRLKVCYYVPEHRPAAEAYAEKLREGGYPKAEASPEFEEG